MQQRLPGSFFQIIDSLMESIRLTLHNCNPYILNRDHLGIVVPIQDTKFPNQLTAEVKLNGKKDVEINAVFDTALTVSSFFFVYFLTFLYNYHKLDLAKK